MKFTKQYFICWYNAKGMYSNTLQVLNDLDYLISEAIAEHKQKRTSTLEDNYESEYKYSANIIHPDN